MTMTIGSLFSGIIGGLELGLERAGLGRVVFQCEIDPFCRSVLAKHWPDAKRYEDVKSIDESAPHVDVLCGGFPCQDISVAGKGAGLDGERSGLWFEFARIIRVLRPRIVVAENVSALLGRGIDRVLGDLSTLGYDAEWSTLRASDVGAPHIRDRVFIIAWRMADADGERLEGSEPKRQRDSEFERSRDGGVEVADAERSEGADASRGSVRHGDDARRIEASGGSSRSGEEILADAASSRCGVAGRMGSSDGGRTESRDGGSTDVADTDGGRREVVGIEEPRRIGCASGDLADGSGASRRLDDRPPWDDDIADVADAERDAVRIEPERSEQRQTECGNSVARDESEGGGRSAEPGLRGSADGVRDRLDRWPAGPDEEQYAWEPPRSLPKGRHPNRAARLKALGNAVVPQVAERVGTEAKRILAERGVPWSL